MQYRRWFSFFLIVLLFSGFSACGGGSSTGSSSAPIAPVLPENPVLGSGTTTLTWDGPESRSDGSPLNASSEISSYRVYFGSSSGGYTWSRTVNGGSNTTCTIDNLASGAGYYFAVTAIDTAGQESGYSEEVAKVIS